MALQVKDIGSFYIGGAQVTLSGLPLQEVAFAKGSGASTIDPNGDFESGQMYVQYVRLEQPKARYPLSLWHGGGLTGSCYETTPDGRPGWQRYFLEQGHDVYTSDSVERGRASWSQYPHIYEQAPHFRTKKQAWETFRIGYSYEERSVRPGQRFPVAAFDMFMKQAVPRWTCNDALVEKAYVEYLRAMGKSVVLAHSQGCAYAIKAAAEAPESVAALILVEPSGVPELGSFDLAQLRHIPHLFLWGDYVHDGKTWWGDFYKVIQAHHERLAAAAVDTQWVDLPKLGITGNTHMLIMDENSDEIAGVIQRWMAEKGLMR